MSWRPDPFAISSDAFLTSWQGQKGYAFPPLGRCLQKVMSEPADSSTLEDATLVSSTAGVASGATNSLTSTQRLIERPLQSTTPAEVPTASRLENIREQHATIGVSEQALHLLVAGWSKGTNTAYQSGGGVGLAGVCQGKWIIFVAGYNLF